MKLTLNPEYARNHLFVVILMAGLGCWFGYDAFVRYPATPAHDLYVSIEKAEPPAGFDLTSFKAQKVKTQYGFTFLSLLASLVIAVRLQKSRALSFEFEEDGFSHAGKRYAYNDIGSVDDSLWEKKNIVKIAVKGEKITLDGWHHRGVKEFYEKIKKPR